MDKSNYENNCEHIGDIMPRVVDKVIRDFNTNEQVKNICDTFPNTTLVFEEKHYHELAQDILIALRQIVVIQKGKKVDRKKLWYDMIDVVVEGLKATASMQELKRGVHD